MLRAVINILVLLSFFHFPLRGQEYVIDIQYFSTEQGLSHRWVNDVFQDSKGYIWLGTGYGLNRFTGHDFQILSKETSGLADNSIEKIFEDAEGWLWVVGKKFEFSQISFVHTTSLEVKSMEDHFGATWPFAEATIYSIISAEDQSLFLSSSVGVFKYAEGIFQKLPIQVEERITLLHYAAEDKRLYASIGEVLKPKSLVAYDEKGTAQLIRAISYVSEEWISFSNTTDIWIHEKDPKSLLKINKFGREQKRYDLRQIKGLEDKNWLFYSTVKPDWSAEDAAFWYMDENNIFLFNTQKQLLDLGKLMPDISKNKVYDIYPDNQGNYWIGTDQGLYKVGINKNPFQNFLSVDRENYTVAEGFSSRGLWVKNEALWANSTINKQYRVDVRTGEATLLPFNPFRLSDRPIFRPIFETADGLILQGEVDIYPYRSEVPQAPFRWKEAAEPEMLWALHQDVRGKIWAGVLSKGIAEVEGDSINNFKQYNDFAELAQHSVYHFLEWDEEHVLVASTAGIFVLHYEKGILGHFATQRSTPYQMPHDVIHHLHRDQENPNRIWVASGGGGLFSFEIEAENWTVRPQSLQHFTIATGLSNNILHAIYEDDSQNLWISSDYGLIRFDKTTKKAKAYTESDGLPHHEFNRISHHQAADGRLFFGSLNGVTSFYPEQLLGVEEEFDVPLRITQFQQFNGEENKLEEKTATLLTEQQIVLQPEDKFFTLEFALLEYNDANQIKYSYRIPEESDDWEYLSNNRLRLSGLNYGQQTLEVRAQGVSGQFSASRISLPLTVLKPIYLRWWFMVGSILLLLLSIVFWYNQRTRFLNKQRKILEKRVQEQTQTLQAQAEELQSLDKLKSRFFANVSHELRTPLTLMLGPIDAALKENQLTNRAYTNLLLAKKNGSRLHRLINEILDLSKLESGKLEIETKPVAWYNFLKNTVASFESMANRQQIRFSFDYQGNKYLQVLTDQRKVEIILLNLLSNAFKFTQNGGKVHFSAKDEGEYLQISLEDTGRGIHSDDLPHVFDRFYQTKFKNAAAEGGTGIGLALTQEFVRLLQGKIEVKSQLGQGTTFIVQLPKKEIISQLASEEAQQIHEESLLEPTETALRMTDTKSASTAESSEKDLILLVEDNDHLQDFIASLLLPDYRVETAENGLVALDKLTAAEQKGQLPDLIITDIMMPLMDGYQLIAKLKSMPVYTSIPILVLTARAGLEDKIKALRIGIDDYLTKPFVQEELFARIDNLLRNAKNRQQLSPSPPLTSPEKTAAAPALSEANQAWLADLENTILDNLQDPNYNLEQLARSMSLSRRQLSRRIQESIGLSPAEYVKTIRFAHAVALLEQQSYDSVKAVALSVGFKDVAHFSRQFKKRFGKSPSEYLE